MPIGLFQVLQEAKEKSEVESKQNNQVEIRKGYAYLLDSFQGNKLYMCLTT